MTARTIPKAPRAARASMAAVLLSGLFSAPFGVCPIHADDDAAAPKAGVPSANATVGSHVLDGEAPRRAMDHGPCKCLGECRTPSGDSAAPPERMLVEHDLPTQRSGLPVLLVDVPTPAEPRLLPFPNPPPLPA